MKNKVIPNKRFVPNPHLRAGIQPLELTGAWVYDEEEITWTGYFIGNDFIVTGYKIEHKTNNQSE